MEEERLAAIERERQKEEEKRREERELKEQLKRQMLELKEREFEVCKCSLSHNSLRHKRKGSATIIFFLNGIGQKHHFIQTIV